MKSARTVLVIDDDPYVLQVTATFLKLHGMSCIGAHDISTALQHLEAGKVDAILLDVHLSGNDALSFVPKLRSLYPSLPIVILTGNGYSTELIERCIQLGAAGVVSKQTDIENVILALQRALKCGSGLNGDPVHSDHSTTTK